MKKIEDRNFGRVADRLGRESAEMMKAKKVRENIKKFRNVLKSFENVEGLI